MLHNGPVYQLVRIPIMFLLIKVLTARSPYCIVHESHLCLNLPSGPDTFAGSWMAETSSASSSGTGLIDWLQCFFCQVIFNYFTSFKSADEPPRDVIARIMQFVSHLIVVQLRRVCRFKKIIFLHLVLICSFSEKEKWEACTTKGCGLYYNCW